MIVILWSALIVASGALPDSEKKEETQQESVEMFCATDAMICPDGKTHVARDPKNNCQFKPCPGEEKTGSNEKSKTTTRRIFDRQGPGVPVNSMPTEENK